MAIEYKVRFEDGGATITETGEPITLPQRASPSLRDCRSNPTDLVHQSSAALREAAAILPLAQAVIPPLAQAVIPPLAPAAILPLAPAAILPLARAAILPLAPGVILPLAPGVILPLAPAGPASAELLPSCSDHRRAPEGRGQVCHSRSRPRKRVTGAGRQYRRPLTVTTVHILF